jgi:ATP-dependent protease Clp ATPase subunit
VEDFHCSFCGKRRREVFKLIAGPGVFICDECTMLCVGVLETERAAGGARLRSDDDDEPKETTEPKLQCGFCGKSQNDVATLIAGPTIHICTDCIDICVDIIEEEIAKQNAPA